MSDDFVFRYATLLLFILWQSVWVIGAWITEKKKPQQTTHKLQQVMEQCLHLSLGLLLAVLLLDIARIWYMDSPLAQVIGFGIVMSSITLSVVARLQLGTNWTRASEYQRGEWWNTIQFFYYAIFLSNIFIAQFLFKLIKSRKVTQVVIACILLLVTLPINIDFVTRYASFPGNVYVSQAQLNALAFLKQQPKGVVLAPQTTKEITERFPGVKPAWATDDTPYVAAYSGKQMYIADEHVLRILGVKYEDRMKKVMSVWDCNLIKEVDYLYDIRGLEQRMNFAECENALRELYKNEEIVIYKVLK